MLELRKREKKQYGTNVFKMRKIENKRKGRYEAITAINYSGITAIYKNTLINNTVFKKKKLNKNKYVREKVPRQREVARLWGGTHSAQVTGR